MTKLQVLMYVGTVFGVILIAYIYTSVAEAPHSLTTPPAAIPDTKIEEIIPPISIGSTSPLDTLEDKDILTDPAAPSTILESTTWYWSHVEDATGVMFTPKKQGVFKMQFTPSRMSSATDCNTVGGSYRIDSNSLTFGPLMSTMMYCPDSEESLYVKFLTGVASFQLLPGMLRLSTNSGVVLVFVEQL